MVTLEYDAEAARRLLAVYGTPDVAAQREAFAGALALRGGEHVLDLGCGPGMLTLLLAQQVGASGQVCGVDISEPLLAHARRLAADRPQLRWPEADATSLPLPDAAFDAAISTQVLEYVAEVDAALAEPHRVLRPHGRLVLVERRGIRSAGRRSGYNSAHAEEGGRGSGLSRRTPPTVTRRRPRGGGHTSAGSSHGD
jgi:SAM-dependent methyltransferase